MAKKIKLEGPVIKVGRNIITLKVGDRIYDNGSCIMIFSGDGRTMSSTRGSTMQGKTTTRFGYVVLTLKVIKVVKAIVEDVNWKVGQWMIIKQGFLDRLKLYNDGEK